MPSKIDEMDQKGKVPRIQIRKKMTSRREIWEKVSESEDSGKELIVGWNLKR